MDLEIITGLLAEAPVVAAVKDDDGLARCLESDAKVVFILYGTVMDIGHITTRLLEADKAVFIHMDLIDGLAPRDVTVDFLAGSTGAHGIISTRPALLRRAREQGLLAIRRFFLLDSMALQNLEKQLTADTADLVEVLPGVMPKILRKVAAISPLPLIAGGLVSDKEDVVNALGAGAIGVSTTSPAVWRL